jgi:hypothetical protein
MDSGQLFLGFAPEGFKGADVASIIDELESAVREAYCLLPDRPWFPEQLEHDATRESETSGIVIARTLAEEIGLALPERTEERPNK